MNKSYLIAAALTLAIALWVVGGYLLKSEATTPARAPAAATTEPMTVAVETQEAKPVERNIVAQGQAEPNRTVTVRSETSGQVAEILAEEGDSVAAGDLIARLKPGDRKARLLRAEARVREQERAYDASKALGEKGYQTQRRLDETYSALQTAKAELDEARIELERTAITAPFAGIVLTSRIELGAYLAVNGEVVTIVDNDPLVVSVRIPQQDIAKVKVGRSASVTFVNGEKRDGTVRYVAAKADEETRTFRTEIEVANPDGAIPSGISVEAKIPTGSVPAHFVSPAALSLNDHGVLGVKTVGDGNKVEFHAAKIVRADNDGIWIAGLPAHSRIITMGQGFVRIGDQVRVADARDDGAPGQAGALPSALARNAQGAR